VDILLREQDPPHCSVNFHFTFVFQTVYRRCHSVATVTSWASTAEWRFSSPSCISRSSWCIRWHLHQNTREDWGIPRSVDLQKRIPSYASSGEIVLKCTRPTYVTHSYP